MNTVYIYALGDPDTCEIRYIGKSIRPVERLQNHMNEVSNCHRSNWLQSLKRAGKRPLMTIIEQITGDMPWQPSERYWIARGRALGWPLTNNTDGGDGVCGLPQEARDRMAATWRGRKHKPETLLKLSAASSARRHSKETRMRMSEVHSGREIKWAGKIAERLRRFSPDEVASIKRRIESGEGTQALASEFGVHRTTISKIKMGTYYAKS